MKELRKIVREVLRESIITERLMNFEDDVDMIYDYYFKDDYEKIEKTKSLKGIEFESSEYSTNFLNSPLAKKANKINPCQIFINIESNHYNPSSSVISLGISSGAEGFVRRNGGENQSIFIASLKLGDEESLSLKREFKEETIKGSIHHELTHWVDDTLHNRHIKSSLKKGIKANEFSGQKINYHYIEIEAIIHNIEQLRRKHIDDWEIMSFEELVKLSPSLFNIYRKSGNDDKKSWIKSVKTRMHREGILGKNMENG